MCTPKHDSGPHPSSLPLLFARQCAGAQLTRDRAAKLKSEVIVRQEKHKMDRDEGAENGAKLGYREKRKREDGTAQEAMARISGKENAGNEDVNLCFITFYYLSQSTRTIYYYNIVVRKKACSSWPNAEFYSEENEFEMFLTTTPWKRQKIWKIETRKATLDLRWKLSMSNQANRYVLFHEFVIWQCKATTTQSADSVQVDRSSK